MKGMKGVIVIANSKVTVTLSAIFLGMKIIQSDCHLESPIPNLSLPTSHFASSHSLNTSLAHFKFGDFNFSKISTARLA